MPKEKPLVDAKSLTLDEWLALATTPDHRRKVRLADYEFPTDVHRDQFLDAIHGHTESTIRTLLRNFLMEGGTMGGDSLSIRIVLEKSDDELQQLMEKHDFYRRLVEPPFLPWQGNTWILDLLPHYPLKALDALDAYFIAHCQQLPDGRINGMADAEAIIRARYLHRENPRDALLALRPEEFEFLIGSLYEKLGYTVRVTQRSNDGGVDIEARSNDAGGKALVLIQCKRYEDVVRVQPVRELMGVVSRRQANKGVVVATCNFTRSAKLEAAQTPMIELVDFAALNRLLNRCLGSEWPRTMSYEIRRMQLVTVRPPTANDA
jgi:restriction system protein